MKKFFGFIFFISLIIPFEFAQAANPFLVSEFVQGRDVFVGLFAAGGRTMRSFWVGSLDNAGGVNVACGNIDNDEQEEIVATFNSGYPKVSFFSSEGKKKHNEFFVYNKKYNGGVNVALGDLDGDEIKEIITAPMAGNLPIRVFNYQGSDLNIPFYPFSKNYRGNISLATGDIDVDGREEIIVGSGEGIETEVRIFGISGDMHPVVFSPFGKEFTGGVNVSAGDINGDGKDEILMCQRDKGSWCKIYDYGKNKQILHQWHVYNNASVRVVTTMADIDRDGRDEIVTLSKSDGKSLVSSFNNTERINNIFNFSIPSGNINNSSIDIFFDSNKDKAKVTYVDDGDTIFLDNNREVRYIGIDTPEIGEDYYVEATNKNKDLVYEKNIELEYDVQKVDPYGRLLAYVYQEGEMINTKLIEAGLARAKTYPPNEKYKDLFEDKEGLARENKLGIWNVEEQEDKKFSFWDLFDFLKIFF